MYYYVLLTSPINFYINHYEERNFLKDDRTILFTVGDTAVSHNPLVSLHRSIILHSHLCYNRLFYCPFTKIPIHATRPALQLFYRIYLLSRRNSLLSHKIPDTSFHLHIIILFLMSSWKSLLFCTTGHRF